MPALVLLCAAQFMVILDITVVSVALPSIQADLDIATKDLQWVVTAYTLAFGGLLLLGGRAADLFGRRRVFLMGLAVFSAASLGAALASTAAALLVARIGQGVGAAMLSPAALSMITTLFAEGRERQRALATWAAVAASGGAFGVLAGGALTETLGWQAIFLINVPVGIAAFAVTYLKLRESRDPHATRIDWPGVATFSASLFLLVLAMVRGNDQGWGSTMIVSLLAGSGVLLAAFVAIERRVSEPMLPLELFKRPAFTGVQLAAFAVSGSLFALFLYLTLYLQNYLGYSPLEAGVRYLPITIASFIAAPIAGMLLSRVPARVMMSVGLTGGGVGLLLMAGVDAGDEWTTLLGGFLVAGAGVGLLNPVIADVAVSVVPKERSGMAAGINDTFRQVGVAVGIAALGALFVGRGADKTGELLAGTPAGSGDRPRELVEAASSGNLDQALGAVPPGAREQVADAAGQGFIAGLNDIFMLGGIMSLAAALAALWLVRERDIEREAVEVHAPGLEREPVPEPA